MQNRKPMPRISTRMILQAFQYDHLLPLLLSECRTIDSAKNELRWLRERALSACRPVTPSRKNATSIRTPGLKRLLKSMCLARSRGMPLQYILGDQPFGDLSIKCTKGVLIPRHETEAITFRAANLILNSAAFTHKHEDPLRIIDLCTGSGCIPLLLHTLLSPHVPHLSIVGIDISAAAIALAEENVRRNVSLRLLSQRALAEIDFQHGNVLEYGHGGFPTTSDSPIPVPRCDVLISNPPYVSPREYHDGTTSRSARMFEPKNALVPPDNSESSIVGFKHVRQEDIFYYHTTALVSRLQVGLVILECGSHSQALRVAALYQDAMVQNQCVRQVQLDIWSVDDRDPGPCAVIIHNNVF
ncbi:S-adenosyl-L-methionine-dependent methyltransferase [Aspergillus crustosus]